MTHYLAFTLGPIYATLRQARKTRELWAASYVFSALMRELLEELKSKGVIAQNESNLIAPIVGKRSKNGAGIFPDRCFIKVSEEITAIIIKKIISGTIERVNKLLPKQPPTFDLANTLRIFAAQISSEEANTQSIILQLNNILDALELQPLVPKGDAKLVGVLEENVQNLYRDGGKSDVFISFDHDKQQRLPSILELATTELNANGRQNKYYEILTEPTNIAILEYQKQQKNNKEGRKFAELHEAEAQEKALLKLKSTFPEAVKFRDKYVCFIKADGDNVGKTIAAIGNNEEGIRKFSMALGKFADDAVKKIIDFKAIPVYAGGDDLLFIAPVQNAVGEHIFKLLGDLDIIFPGSELEALGKEYNPGFDFKPSLSFGLSISYYKYPMSEALDNMDYLLFKEAKHFTGKNALSFRVLKHSGQAFGTTIGKGDKDEAFKKFSSLLLESIKPDPTFLTSVMHRLTELKPFMEDSLQNGGTEYFFKHHFNESDHTTSGSQDYLKAVRRLCEAAWEDEKHRREFEKSEKRKLGVSEDEINLIVPDIDVVTNQIYAVLRFVQFLIQKDHE